MLKVQLTVYDVKKRDQYSKIVETPHEQVVDFTTVAIDAERLIQTTVTMMCAALDVEFVHDGENFAFGKDRANASR